MPISRSGPGFGDDRRHGLRRRGPGRARCPATERGRCGRQRCPAEECHERAFGVTHHRRGRWERRSGAAVGAGAAIWRWWSWLRACAPAAGAWPVGMVRPPDDSPKAGACVPSTRRLRWREPAGRARPQLLRLVYRHAGDAGVLVHPAVVVQRRRFRRAQLTQRLRLVGQELRLRRGAEDGEPVVCAGICVPGRSSGERFVSRASACSRRSRTCPTRSARTRPTRRRRWRRSRGWRGR